VGTAVGGDRAVAQRRRAGGGRRGGEGWSDAAVGMGERKIEW
jgi:hypothetical protein